MNPRLLLLSWMALLSMSGCTRPIEATFVTIEPGGFTTGSPVGCGSRIEQGAHATSATGVHQVGSRMAMASSQRDDFASERRLRTA